MSNPTTADHSARNTAGPQIVYLPLGQIAPSPFQRRQAFDHLEEMAESIRAHGVLQPITVRAINAQRICEHCDYPGNSLTSQHCKDCREKMLKYELIAGERRLRGARLAGLDVIPALVRDVDDRTAAELVALENLQRDDLNAIEVAESYRLLVDMGLTEKQIGDSLGRAQPTIANALRLLELPAAVQEKIRTGELSASHGRALMRWTNTPKFQAALATIAGNLPVKKLEGDLDQGLFYTEWEAIEKAGGCAELDYQWQQRCGACRFRLGHRRCLDPDCYQKKAAELKAQEEAETQKLLERASSTSQAVPKLTDLKYDAYELLSSPPDGCKEDCPHRGVAMHGSQAVAVCLKPKCYRKLANAKEQAEKDARIARAEQKVEKARVMLQEATSDTHGALHRVLAIAISKAGNSLTAKKIRDAGERLGLVLDGRELEHCWHPHTSHYLKNLAGVLSIEQLIRILGEFYLLDNVRSLGSWSGAEMGETQFILGQMKGKDPHERVAAETPLDTEGELVPVVKPEPKSEEPDFMPGCHNCGAIDDDECPEESGTPTHCSEGICNVWRPFERTCRICGCTEEDACETEEGPCDWVEDDVCSACSQYPDQPASVHECHFCHGAVPCSGDENDQAGCAIVKAWQERLATLSATPP
jgi:ParB family chromosome partitioning protein